MSGKQVDITILIADDDRDDREMTLEAFQENRLRNDLHFVEDGEQVLRFLRHQAPFEDALRYPRPGLILLDLNMPRLDGRSTLKAIKADEALRQIPVIVLTTSKAEEDVFSSYDVGASSYIRKPVKLSALVEAVGQIGRYWLEIVDLPEGERK